MPITTNVKFDIVKKNMVVILTRKNKTLITNVYHYAQMFQRLTQVTLYSEWRNPKLNNLISLKDCC